MFGLVVNVHNVRSIKQKFVEYENTIWTSIVVRHGRDPNDTKEIEIILFPATDEHVQVEKESDE